MIKNISKITGIALLSITITVFANETNSLENNINNGLTIEQKALMEKSKNAVLALNYLHTSLNKIVMYNDKRVLEEEYDNIINNINLTAINDKEIVDIITKLMDTLSAFRLKEMDKEQLQKQYEKKLESALSDLLIETGSNITIASLTGNISSAKQATVKIIETIQNPYNVYSKIKDQRDASLWQLKKGDIKELNKIRKEFLVTYWKIMKRYNIPDNWRITEKQFTRFVNVSKGTDANKKFRQLMRMKDELAMLPTYWFELSLVAHDLGKKNEEFEAIKKYESLNQKLLRRNSQYSMMLANEIAYLDPKKDKGRIVRILEKLHKVDPYNAERKIFSAVGYASIGELKKAEQLLDENIDDGFLPVVSEKMKLKLFLKSNQETAYKSTINDLLEKQKLSVLENLIYLDEYPIESLAKAVKREVDKIGIIIKKSFFGKDNLVVALPKQWVLKDIEDAELFVLVDKNQIKSEKSEVEDDFIVYSFKNAISVSDLKQEKVKQITLKLVYKEIPTEIAYDIKIEKPKKEKQKKDNKKENTESNESSYFGSLLKKGKTVLSEYTDEENESNKSSYLNALYEKGEKALAEYRSEIKFVPNKIKMKNRCFDVLNDLKPCHK